MGGMRRAGVGGRGGARPPPSGSGMGVTVQLSNDW